MMTTTPTSHRTSKTKHLRRCIIAAILVVIARLLVLLQSQQHAIVDAPSYGRWGPSAMVSMERNGATRTDNDSPKPIPQWLIEYSEWHASVRKKKDWFKTQNVLIVLAIDSGAEGLADRLRSLPFLLLEAHQAKRVLLIQWIRPFPLEEFLLPPKGGIDWRTPTSLASKDGKNYPTGTTVVRHKRYKTERDFKRIADCKAYQRYQVVTVQPNISSFFQGMELVYATLNPSLAEKQISNIFHYLLFTPSPPVQHLLDETMQRLKLSPKQYVGVHLRSRYPDYIMRYHLTPVGWNETKIEKTVFNRELFTHPMGPAGDMAGIQTSDRVKETLKQLGRAAIGCARKNLIVEENGPVIYFASDTNLAVQLAIEENSNDETSSKGPRVVGMVTSKERLHINSVSKADVIKSSEAFNTSSEEDGLSKKLYTPSDFYPTFVDCWILSQARCISAGQGGYALFSAMLGGSGSCLTFHSIHSVYATKHLPSGYVTIRNITFCRPQQGGELQQLAKVIRVKTQQAKREKFSLPTPSWNIGK